MPKGFRGEVYLKRRRLDKVTTWVKMPKLFMEHPLGRHTTIRIKWYPGDTDGIKWYALAPGNDDLLYEFYDKTVTVPPPSIRPEPRAPTAIDLNVLYILIHYCQFENPVEFPTFRQFSIVTTNQAVPYFSKSIMDALRLWQQLGLTVAGVRLPPPITRIETKPRARATIGRPLKFHIHKAWIKFMKDLTATYTRGTAPFLNVPVPLTCHTTPHNLTLHALWYGNATNLDINAFFRKCSGRKNIAPENAPHTPYRSWLVVEKWIKKHKGKFDWARTPYLLEQRGPRVRLRPSRTFSIFVQRPKPPRQWFYDQKKAPKRYLEKREE